MPEIAHKAEANAVATKTNPGGRLVSEGAHEIRSQLAVILLELGKLDQPAARRIENDVQTVSDTVNRVATLFRLTLTENLDFNLVNIEETLIDVVRRVQVDRPNCNIALNRTAPSSVIDGHRGFIAQAMLCLIDNAVRHTPLGTQVVVRCYPGGLVIQDDGPGLPSNVLKHFTEPFVRGRCPTAGAGLGLAMAHQIARLHGGHCRTAPPTSGGTAVYFTWSQSQADGCVAMGPST
jgi:signal transduction histidine kinase